MNLGLESPNSATSSSVIPETFASSSPRALRALTREK